MPESASQPVRAEMDVEVRYAETDQMGVVYHSNFLIWFEVGRVELLRQMGFSYKEMEQQDDCHIAVVDLRCRYKAPGALRRADCRAHRVAQPARFAAALRVQSGARGGWRAAG